MSRIAYRRIGYAIIRSSSKERRAKCKMTEKDRQEQRGNCDRLASASGKHLLKVETACMRKRRVECR